MCCFPVPADQSHAAEQGLIATGNWDELKQRLGGKARGDGAGHARRAAGPAKCATSLPHAGTDRDGSGAGDSVLPPRGNRNGVTDILAIDCEMVGVGESGRRSALARVCIVNDDGNVIYDEYVKPKERVTDFRSAVSGILPSHMDDHRRHC